ncbi:hypothetical protein ACLN6N_06140 [Sphingomonas carotinifaciens]|uniref:hypothetical protein n=1 Tax=Sphingomonas carotinifaciens TaxID=1166323 RepID=UPI0039A33555
MTKAEYARHRGVKPSAVSNWVKAGHIVFCEDPVRPDRMVVDVARTDARLNSRIDPTRGRPTTGIPHAPAPQVAEPELGDMLTGVRTAAQVRIELAEEQLIERRQKNARDAGELAPRVELDRRAAELGRVVRERMHAMFRAISERLAAEREVRTILAIGSAEIDRVFADLADEVERGALVEDADETVEDQAIENEVEAQLAED